MTYDEGFAAGMRRAAEMCLETRDEALTESGLCSREIATWMKGQADAASAPQRPAWPGCQRPATPPAGQYSEGAQVPRHWRVAPPAPRRAGQLAAGPSQRGPVRSHRSGRPEPKSTRSSSPRSR